MIQPLQSQANPFPYGWRYVKRVLPDGRIEFDQVPLTLEDALHPQYGDVMPENTPHSADRSYLYTVFQSRTASDPTALVLTDLLIIWDVPGLRQHSPDISVIFGVRNPQRVWTSFNVAEEGARPTLLVEIVSPDYRVNDVTTKVEHYERAGVPLYIIVDRERPEGPPRLIGYRLGLAGYEPMTPDAEGRLWLEPLRLWIGTRDNRVVCYDPDTGAEIGDYAQVVRDLAEEERARQAAEARAAEEERARQAAEARAAEEERARQVAEARAAEEERARQAAEARIQELEEQLRRLLGNRKE